MTIQDLVSAALRLAGVREADYSLQARPETT